MQTPWCCLTGCLHAQNRLWNSDPHTWEVTVPPPLIHWHEHIYKRISSINTTDAFFYSQTNHLYWQFSKVTKESISVQAFKQATYEKKLLCQTWPNMINFSYRKICIKPNLFMFIPARCWQRLEILILEMFKWVLEQGGRVSRIITLDFWLFLYLKKPVIVSAFERWAQTKQACVLQQMKCNTLTLLLLLDFSPHLIIVTFKIPTIHKNHS